MVKTTRHKDFVVTKSVSLPVNVIVEVDNRAFAEGLGFSEKLLVLVRKGILFEEKMQAAGPSVGPSVKQ